MAGDRLAGNAAELPTRHHLIPLWTRALPLMRAAWKTDWTEADATSVKDVIAEFDKVDPDSMATRYPVNKSNAAFARPAQLLNFSVVSFMEAFSRAADFLSAGNLWIEVGLRLKAEGIGEE